MKLSYGQYVLNVLSNSNKTLQYQLHACITTSQQSESEKMDCIVTLANSYVYLSLQLFLLHTTFGYTTWSREELLSVMHF